MPGDRSWRQDDRNNQFLEAVFSVCQKLIVTYVGQRLEDNRLIPPSLVGEDLLDVREARCTSPSLEPV